MIVRHNGTRFAMTEIHFAVIPFDYSGQLSALLRYPAVPSNPQITMPHTSLLLRQALSLRASPTPTAGVTIVMENRDFLSIPAEVPEAPVSRRPPGGRPTRGGHKAGTLSFDHRRDLTGIQDLISSRLSDVNSAVASTVSEFRVRFFPGVYVDFTEEIFKKNLPELSLNDISSALMGPGEVSSDFSTPRYQAMSRQVTKSPRQTHQTEEPEDQHTRNAELARAMSWSLETLRSAPTGMGIEQIEKRKAVAMETLSYVQQILSGSSISLLDESRLRCPWDGARDRSATQEKTPAVVSRQAATVPFAASGGSKSPGKPNPFSRHDSSISNLGQGRSSPRTGQSSSLFSPSSPTNLRHDSAMSLHMKATSQPSSTSRQSSDDRLPVADDPLGALD